nr:GEVED domain-containing protein [Salinivirgaceae bacterium]
SFNDISTNTPTSWSWSFTGGTPSTSTAQNATITYNTVGTYQVSLTATNAGGSDTETKAAYITVEEEGAIDYCASKGNNVTYEWLAGVQIGDFTNNTAANGGYADFTGQVVNLAAGASVDVTLTPGFQSSTYAEYYKIWIDYNNDGDFEDAGEEVFANNASGAVSGTLTVASNASGTTRMRVTMKYNAAPTPCESFSYGEVEDYTVTFGSAPAPVANFSANATTITAGASVSFTDQSTNNPTAWAWSFDGATPSTSTTQNPTVTYNTAGTYQVSLTVSNGTGNDTETKYSYITVEAGDVTYCASKGNNSSYEWIEKIVIDGFTNTSGDNGGYQDYTNQMVNLAAGASANFTLTPGFSGSTYQEYWKIWIDYNKDGDFTDAGELVASGNGTGAISGSVNVSASASGTTRMRVTMKYNAAPTSCETFSYGEVEDYTVTFGSKDVTGIYDAVDANVSIYPQPADELIHIEMTDASNVADIKLYNMNGQLVNAAKVDNNGNGFDYDVSARSAGVYMMQIVTNDSIISKRVVIK